MCVDEGADKSCRARRCTVVVDEYMLMLVEFVDQRPSEIYYRVLLMSLPIAGRTSSRHELPLHLQDRLLKSASLAKQAFLSALNQEWKAAWLGSPRRTRVAQFSRARAGEPDGPGIIKRGIDSGRDGECK